MSHTNLSLAAATLALAALHPQAHATADWLTVAPTCVPDSPQSLQLGLTSLTGGYVRAGRNPPVAYFCPVWNPDDFAAAVPSWKYFKLQALDPNANGGSIVATLYAKSRANGAVSPVTSVGSLQSSTVKVATVALPASLNFKRYAYYVTIEMAPPSLPAEAHMVMLTN